ncbi:MAG: RNA polymerase subunit sigma [Bacteroides sp.]|nr:RNA polymerase subunit sigma [Bacteroides sp.]
MKNKIETRKSEIRYVTSDPDRMLGKFIARRVLKTWMEDYVESDTGRICSIERSEVLFEKGTYVSPEVQASIRFYKEAGEISEVEVSNQKRLAMVEPNHSLYPYKAVVRSNEGSRKTFLFYALSIGNALEILTDYVELNFNGGFLVSDIKGLDYCVVIIDNLQSPSKRRYEIDAAYLKDEISMEEYVNATCDGIEGGNQDAVEQDDDSSKEVKKFYQIVAHIVLHHDVEGDEEEDATFIVQTFSAVRANMLIEMYLRNKQEQHYQESLLHPERTFVKRQIKSFIEESKIIPIHCFIPVAFSEAYCNENDH